MGPSWRFILFPCIALVLLAAPGGYAQEDPGRFPSRPMNFIIPIPPGGPTDLAFRLLCREAEKVLGKPFVVVNKPGAGQSIGMAAIAVAKPDGYTIGQSGNSGLLLVPHIEKVPYDPQKDFRQIIQCGGFNFGVFVKADSPFKDFKDLIVYARQNPKKLTFGSTVNSIQYLVMEQVARKERVEITHIPFKGTPEVEAAVLGGHVQVGVGDFSYSLVEAAQTRLLLLLREEKSAEYPKVPIMKDLGYADVPAPYYLGVCGPKGIPDAIVKKIEDAFAKGMKEQAVINGMKELHLPIIYRNSRDLDAYVQRNYETFGRLYRAFEKK